MWRRDEIDIGDRFTHEDRGGSIYEVIAIVERPMVVLRPVSVMGPGASAVGNMDIHQVIDSQTFSYWKKVRLEGPQR